MTPLIDVVFILLLFFMLSSTFVQTKHIELRTTAKAKQQQQVLASKILITSAHTVSVDGISYTISAERLSDHLTRLGRQGKSVSVYARKDVPVQAIVQLLDMSKQYGLDTLRLGESVPQ